MIFLIITHSCLFIMWIACIYEANTWAKILHKETDKLKKLNEEFKNQYL